MPCDSPLRRISGQFGIRILEHNPQVGGRFSILSNVGLIPALFSGVDIEKLRSGAADFLNNYAALAVESAAIHVALMRKNIWQNVLFTYADRLEDLNTWYRQIWAESLGKNGTGSNPIKALGTIDQHSQLQVFLDGRKDKFFNFITHDFTNGLRRESDKLQSFDGETSYFAGKTLGDVMNAEMEATIQTLAAHNLPVRTIGMAKLDEESLGMLIMHLMLETILTANLLGVNPI